RHGLLTRVNLSTFAVFERRWVVVGFESLSRFCCPYQREREDTDKRTGSGLKILELLDGEAVYLMAVRRWQLSRWDLTESMVSSF
ncbi:unnamed protein product, partial [Brassica oleracea]